MNPDNVKNYHFEAVAKLLIYVYTIVIKPEYENCNIILVILV